MYLTSCIDLSGVPAAPVRRYHLHGPPSDTDGHRPGCDDTGHVYYTGKNTCHELAHDLSIAQEKST